MGDVTITIEYLDPRGLSPDPENPRRMSAEQQASLRRSLHEHGFVEPAIARQKDLTLIAGHQRVEAAIAEGLGTVPVVLLDVTPEQGRLLGLALNRIEGDWDESLLARMLAELEAIPGIDLSLSGFGGDEIRDLLRGLEAQEKRDRVESFDLEEALAEADRVRRTARGELWALGEHRLLVGDATRSEDVERVLGGRRADLVWTDPPYNVGLGDHGGQGRGSRRRRLENDALDPAAWEAFVTGWARTLLGACDGALYICTGSKELPTVSRVLASEGGHWSDTIIWTKDRFVLGRADYQRAYEPVWYGWREGAKRTWCGDRDQSDVWSIPRPSASPLHPTMKPVELIERSLVNSSRSGALVLDPFAGSGGTLIACERTGRIAALVEIDPRYADVLLARGERFSGQRAERVDG